MLGLLKTTRSFPKIPEEVRSLPKTSEVIRRCINASSLPGLFTWKIRDREEGIVIYSFYTSFSFLTWVWVNIFLEIGSSKMATTHIFQSGVRNWSTSVSRREIEVFNPQPWDSRLRRESWQVYLCWQLFNILLYMRKIRHCDSQANKSSGLLSNSTSFTGIKKLWQLWSAKQDSHKTRAICSKPVKNRKKPGFFNLFVQISGWIWTVVSRGYFSHDSSNSESVASAYRVTFAMLNNIICRA